MKLFKGINSQIKEERNNVFDEMSLEENHQRELRMSMSKEIIGDDELAELKAEYDLSVKHWKELNEHYKTYDAMGSKFKVSPDTLLTVIGSVAQIVLILNYEKIGVVTSKAVNYITKKRV